MLCITRCCPYDYVAFTNDQHGGTTFTLVRILVFILIFILPNAFNECTLNTDINIEYSALKICVKHADFRMFFGNTLKQLMTILDIKNP